MFEKFEALSEVKKKTIINAAMTEFVKGGYEKASMNVVVHEAGISKGSLFYYFGNKKQLYIFLFEYCEGLIIENAHRHLDKQNSDFLRRMEHVMRCNISLLKDYPLVYGFVVSCKSEKSDSVASEIQTIKVKKTDELFSSIYKEIDETLFKTDIDIQMALYAIKSTMFQIIHDAMREKEPKNEDVLNKIGECSKFFRTTFYK